MKAKRLLFLVMAICLANGMKAQLHRGVYTQKANGQSTITKQYITGQELLLNVEFYHDYIKVEGSRIDFSWNVNNGMTTLTPGNTRKCYSQARGNGEYIVYMVDSNYNMEVAYVNMRGGSVIQNVLFPMTKGNTLSSSGYNNGGYNSGSYSGGSYSGNSSGASQSQNQKTRKWCSVCSGSGKCRICNGSGWVTRLGMGKSGYCASCYNHNGKCTVCGGRGEWYE